MLISLFINMMKKKTTRSGTAALRSMPGLYVPSFQHRSISLFNVLSWLVDAVCKVTILILGEQNLAGQLLVHHWWSKYNEASRLCPSVDILVFGMSASKSKGWIIRKRRRRPWLRHIHRVTAEGKGEAQLGSYWSGSACTPESIQHRYPGSCQRKWCPPSC